MEDTKGLSDLSSPTGGQGAHYKKGRGAQINTKNSFSTTEQTREHAEGIDDWIENDVKTTYLEVFAKSIVNSVDSPDIDLMYSMNPYQGCEHGCIYCYARNSFEYWGYSAGVDFESKILIKKNAPELLRKFLMHPKWKPVPIMLSGNTDCYQPAEQKFGLTRKLLEVCYEFGQPVGILTKNAAILKDKDLLQNMSKRGLVSVMVSITTLNEKLRQVMEPRTTTGAQRMRVIETLSNAGIRTGVMMGPMIPGLNEHEMQTIMKRAKEAGALFSGYTFVRLNGAVKLLFHDWLYKNFPDRADKVWHLIEGGHGGNVSDSRWGVRMRGEGPMAEVMAQGFKKWSDLFGFSSGRWELDKTRFQRPGAQGSLF